MVDQQPEQVLVLAKSIGLTWNATAALLQLKAGAGACTAEELERASARFNKLQPDTARKAVQFYRLRERATMSLS